MKLNNSLIPVAIVGTLALLASTRVGAADLIQNGGFEDGVQAGSGAVPTDWTENAGYDLEPGFNDVRTTPFSGDHNLSIGNFDYQPVATLSQTFADVSGDDYTVSMEVYATDGGDSDAFFNASIDGNAPGISLVDTINSYTLESFNFTGTGSDTLTLAAATNPGEWYVDDVSVTGAGAVPDQASSIALLALGLAALIFSQYCQRRRKLA